MTGAPSQLRLAYLADDFTGATDAIEVLATEGVRAALFARPPTPQLIARYPDVQAIGLAVPSRAMTPPQMDAALPPLLRLLRDCRSPLVHYKVCSTFDSAAHTGSIGRAIELGIDVFGPSIVPVVVGAPSLGRHVVFGNLFARSGADSELFRLDRHPSMSRHPVTPMDEADLRVHLSRQTSLPIGLVDVLTLERGTDAARSALRLLKSGGFAIALIDLLLERQLPAVGALLDDCADERQPGFAVGSSGVESALCEHWRSSGRLGTTRAFPSAHDAGPIVVIVGSRSPVTARQRRRAIDAGFGHVAIDLLAAQRPAGRQDEELNRATAAARAALDDGRSVVVDVGDATATSPGTVAGFLARAAARIVAETGVRRMLVAGGDTSGAVAASLAIESIEMIATLARGAPLCRASAPGQHADGLEVIFKGGQVGDENLFLAARGGRSALSR